MAITCKWNCVVGYVKHEPTGTELTLYGGGNVFACICKDQLDEQGEMQHCLWDFICDKNHLQAILSSQPNHYNEYVNFEFDGNKKEIWAIAKLLVKYGHKVTISDGLLPF